MTKIKEASGNKSVVKFKSANGKVIKAKHLEAISESMTKQQSQPPPAAGFVNKYRLKSTSTPMAVTGKKKAVNGDQLNFNTTLTCRFPLSPILMGDGNVRYAENGNNLLSTIRPNTGNIIDGDKPKKSLTKRRTFGMRRLFSAVDDQFENDHGSIDQRNPKVILSRSPLRNAIHAGGSVSMGIHSGKDTEVQQCDLQDNSLIRNLRNDWSNSTLCQTLLKTPHLQNISNVFKKQPKLRIKRLLTPLIEGICEESNVSKNKENREDENYSSAAEFESDDEKENCRLKRAPTWKSLHSKINESTHITPAKIQLRRSRRLSRCTDVNVIDEDDNVEQYVATNNTATKIQNNNHLSQVTEELDENRVEQNNLKLCTSKDTTSETKVSSRSDVHSKTNVSGGRKLPKLKLRRLRLDSKIKQRAPQSVETLSIASVDQLANKVEASPKSQITKELSNSSQELQKHESVRLPRLKLRRFKINSKKKERVPQSVEKLSDDSIDKLAGNGLQALQEHRPTATSPLRNQESISSDTENIFNENFHFPTSKAGVNEQRPHSPTYDDVEDNSSTIAKCDSKKIFHSRICPTPAVQKAIETPKKKEPRKRKKKEQDNIYDFFSQSSSEVVDPVADIIQKMISTGKVTLAKRNKHTGKTVISRQRRKKENKTKIDKDVFAKPKSIPKKQQPPQKRKDIPAIGLDDDDESHFDDFSENHLENVDPRREQGSFSGLARSTMIKQAGKNGKIPQRQMITDRGKLLELAKKIVGQSTPVKQSTEATNLPQLSPIYGNKSPWRGDDNDHLPTTFYFGRNSDNMPSYSSDYIPETQTENKRYSVSDHVPIPIPQAENKTKSVSSFSSNDSDAENIAPSGVQENLRIAATPILRRGLSNRSPLKSINIIDVVNLPPLVFDNTAKETTKDNNKTISTRPTSKSTSLPNKTVQDETRTNETVGADVQDETRTNKTVGADVQDETRTNKTVGADVCANKTDLFGFEDIIDEEDDSTETNLSTTAIPTKEDLKEKLQRLKRLRPEVPPISASKLESVPAVFDGPKLRQKSLRQMLCSTMIDQPKRVGQETRNDFFNDGCDADLSNLFKDPEPETTFNESDSRRTYLRPYQIRKRKVRNNFVMFLDSDASEEEDENAYEKRAKKRHKNEPKNTKELNKFVDEFNEMCKEVSQYQLVVE